MRNFIESGEQPTVTLPYAVAAGGGVLVGEALFGVAANDCATGAQGVIRTVGVYDLFKVAGAISNGAKLYWDNTAKAITTTASGNKFVGVAIAPAASADTIARIRLNGFAI